MDIVLVSGKMSWEQVLRYASLRKRYISLYASLLKSDPTQVTISGNKEIEDLDRELDIELILQWRYVVCFDMLVFNISIKLIIWKTRVCEPTIDWTVVS